uniref:Uncharacterized protein n=1 Tax=Anguilla anguilla TaxID=7936 RepID=A0A0E9RPK5_ANGAN
MRHLQVKEYFMPTGAMTAGAFMRRAS